MRRLILILLALAAAAVARAQDDGFRIWGDEALSLGYNRNFGLYSEDVTVFGFDSRRVRATGGVNIHSVFNAVNLDGMWKHKSGVHSFGLETFGLAKWSREYNFEEFSLGALGFWSFGGRVEARAGTFFKWIMPLSGSGTDFEPLNFAYSLSFWARPMDKKFNFGASLSNLDVFTAERFYCPMLCVNLNYAITDHYTVYVRWREHNSGIFDLTSNTYDRQFRVGTVISW